MFRKNPRILALVLVTALFCSNIPSFAMESEIPGNLIQEPSLTKTAGPVTAEAAAEVGSAKKDVVTTDNALPKPDADTATPVPVKPTPEGTADETEAIKPSTDITTDENQQSEPDIDTITGKSEDKGALAGEIEPAKLEAVDTAEKNTLRKAILREGEVAETTLAAVTATSDMDSGPPWTVSVNSGKLTAKAVIEGGEDDSGVTYQWYMTEESNTTLNTSEEPPTMYVNLEDQVEGTKIDNATDKVFTVDAGGAQLGMCIYCVATLNGVTVRSNAYRVSSAPPLIGDLIINYDNNTITAPLEDDSNAGNFAKADVYAEKMTSGEGKFIINPDTGQEISTTEITYDTDKNFLTAKFNTSFKNLGTFTISVGRAGYLAILRNSTGKVPLDIIAKIDPAVVVTLSSGGQNQSNIALNSDYIKNIIEKVKTANPGKRIVLTMQGNESGTLTLSSAVIKSVAESDSLYVSTNDATISVNQTLLAELGNKGSDVAMVAINTSLPDNTNEEAKEAISDRAVVDLSLTASGGAITEFGDGGEVKVLLPYTLGSGEAADNLVIYYIKENGTTETISDAVYADGYVTFVTNHFSTFAIGYNGEPVPTPPPSGDGGNNSNDTSSGGNGSSSNNSTGSGNSGSSTGSAGSTADAASLPNTPTLAAVSTTGTVNNSLLSETITENMVKNAISGQSGTGTGIAVSFGNTATGYTDVAAAFERNALERLQTAGVKSVELDGAVLDLSFDQKAIAGILAQTTGNITVSATKQSKPSGKISAVAGNRPVYDITVTGADGKRITGLNGAITVGIAYQPTAREKAGNLCGMYLDGNGRPVLLPHSSYRDGKVIFTQSNLTVCGVGYMAEAPAFTDTNDHWAKDNIDFAVSRGLITGTGKAAFSPDTPVTSADFLTALGKLCGAEISGYRQSSFSDVPNGSPAMPYIEWSAQNGIMAGNNGIFTPEAAITREQMAVLLMNYAKAVNNRLPMPRQAVPFADSAQISGWAKEPVKALLQTGIIAGKQGNRFDPQGKVTRAEAATMLRRFVELVIDAETARGFIQNDSGQWQYITPSGKPQSGWLTPSGGATYWFDDKGIMAAGKWVQLGGKWYYFYAAGNLAVNTGVDGYTVGADGARI